MLASTGALPAVHAAAHAHAALSPPAAHVSRCQAQRVRGRAGRHALHPGPGFLQHGACPASLSVRARRTVPQACERSAHTSGTLAAPATGHCRRVRVRGALVLPALGASGRGAQRRRHLLLLGAFAVHERAQQLVRAAPPGVAARAMRRGRVPLSTRGRARRTARSSDSHPCIQSNAACSTGLAGNVPNNYYCELDNPIGAASNGAGARATLPCTATRPRSSCALQALPSLHGASRPVLLL
jgi:hypothetical protein